MSTYTIKDLEKLTGIKAHTIRIWEQRYNIVEPKRTDTNIRYYDDEQLKHLLNISLLVESGYKISKISALQNNEIYERIKELYAVNKDADISNFSLSSQVNALILAMIELNEVKFEKVFSSNLMRLGFDKTITDVIYPFLNKVGIMWTINEINPAQEHFISCLIRQKLIVAIDSLNLPPENSEIVVLYLAEGEMHEIGLLLSSYIIKSAGKRVIYLGQNVPLNDVFAVVDQCDANYIFTFFTAPMKEGRLQAHLDKASEAFVGKTYLVAGSQLSHELEFSENTKCIFSPTHLLEFIQKEFNS